MREAERFEDMSRRGRLRVLQQDDGDMIVEVVEDLDSQSPSAGLSASVEFCTSGGKSPKTRAALLKLMLAMAEENAARPHCLRRGERGLGVDQPLPEADDLGAAERAERSPQPFDVTLNEEESDLVRQTIGDDEDAGPIRMLVGLGHSGYGLYLARADYQPEGAILLKPMDQTSSAVVAASSGAGRGIPSGGGALCASVHHPLCGESAAAGPARRAAPARRGLYVASRASVPARAAMWRALREAGWPIVATWIDEAGEGETENFSELWARIEREIRSAQGLIVYAEPGDFPLKGAYLEAGIALGAGLPVAVVMPGVDLEPRSARPMGSWIRHPRVTVCATLEEARSVIEAAAVADCLADGGVIRLTDVEYAVLAERRRQVSVEGWTPERDRTVNTSADLAQAAAFYAVYDSGYEAGRVVWPGDPACCKPKGTRRNYERGAALLIGALEMLSSVDTIERGQL